MIIGFTTRDKISAHEQLHRHASDGKRSSRRRKEAAAIFRFHRLPCTYFYIAAMPSPLCRRAYYSYTRRATCRFLVAIVTAPRR